MKKFRKIGQIIDQKIREYKRYKAKGVEILEDGSEISWAEIYRSQMWSERFIADQVLEAIDRIEAGETREFVVHFPGYDRPFLGADRVLVDNINDAHRYHDFSLARKIGRSMSSIARVIEIEGGAK